MPQILEQITNLFYYGFLQRAFIIAILVSVACSLLSVFVVLRRMAFIGQGISHAAFGGVALGLLLFETTSQFHWAINLITAFFCIVIALLIGIVTKHTRISEDSVIGIFFSISMALGVIFIALRKTYAPEVFTYLFGNILSVTWSDVLIEFVLSFIVIVSFMLFYKELQTFVFNEELAKVSGIPVDFLRYFLLVLLSLTIVISIKIIGIVLISAFLVIPGATAQLLAGSFRSMFSIAVVFGVTSSLLGLLISYFCKLPSGATIVLFQFLLFILALFFKKRRI